jgi:UDP-N-acetylmuramoyl-L-alanyl-D-glutamate--2,6-diaminopimelate ligase
VSVELEKILGRLPASTQVLGDAHRAVLSIEIDSRKVGGGALFIAVRGEHVDGHAFIADAIARGATAILAEIGHALPHAQNVTFLLVPDSRRALSEASAAFYGDPSLELDVVGVTGTNGKTTVTHMVAAILESAQRPCGIIGTVGASLGPKSWPLSHTTPLPPELQGLLAQMRADGARAVAMEVSSHALALDRVENVRFRAGVLTNVTRDHLDFHQTLEAYAAAKHRLFTMCETAVINLDDEQGARWAPDAARRIPTLTYSTRDSARADLVARDIRAGTTQTNFSLDGIEVCVPFPGSFNVANALAAIGAARHLGVDDATSQRALASMPSVPGRMEYVGDGSLNAVVDYAHTPDALYHALWSLRDATNGVALVFGCGGDRDRGKREEMGRIAAAHARRIYVTSDNPRSEDPLAIIAEIERGIGAHDHVVEPDRKRAIERAIGDAQPGEIVLIAGKGHEKYQIVGDRVLPFDDVKVAQEAIRTRRMRV